MQFEPWIGIDLDGTLAEHEEGDFRKHRIGKIIPRMRDRLLKHLDEGKTVKIFTARVANERGRQKERKAIQHWLMMNGMPPLDVTHEKDPGLIKLYDDRAAQVEKNSGKLLIEDMD